MSPAPRPAIAQRPCVLFDFDGTLADTKPAIVATVGRVLREFGLTEEEVGDASRVVGPPFPAAFTIVYGLSDEDAAEVTRRFRAIYSTLGPETHPLFPGIRELLERLRASGRTLGITSSKMQHMCERMLADEGVDGLFEAIVGQTDPTRADKASLVADTLERLGFGPDEAVMVGDRLYDVAGAAANGVPCVGVEYAGTAAPGELEEAGAAVVAGSVAELSAVLMGE